MIHTWSYSTCFIDHVVCAILTNANKSNINSNLETTVKILRLCGTNIKFMWVHCTVTSKTNLHTLI